MKEYYSHSPEDTQTLAKEICEHIPRGSLVLFTGGLGAGKTAFVRGALKAYGNASHASSPTFALVNDYGGDPHIYHFDLYRVGDLDDLYSTGFFDYLDENSILFVEWSENISEIADRTGALHVFRIGIERTGEPDGRIITVRGGDFGC